MDDLRCLISNTAPGAQQQGHLPSITPLSTSLQYTSISTNWADLGDYQGEGALLTAGEFEEQRANFVGHKVTAREKIGLFPIEAKRKSDFERTGWSQKTCLQLSALFSGLGRFRVYLHSPMTESSRDTLWDCNSRYIFRVSQLVLSKVKLTPRIGWTHPFPSQDQSLGNVTSWWQT